MSLRNTFCCDSISCEVCGGLASDDKSPFTILTCRCILLDSMRLTPPCFAIDLTFESSAEGFCSPPNLDESETPSVGVVDSMETSSALSESGYLGKNPFWTLLELLIRVSEVEYLGGVEGRDGNGETF